MTARKSAASAGKTGRASDREDRQLGTEGPTNKKSRAEHSEHPESPGDSTVRHARPARGGEAAGEKGFPQGEYDVTDPAKEGAGSKKGAAPKKEKVRSVRDAHLLALAANSRVSVEDIKARLKEPNANRLSAEQRAIAGELLPVGVQIEHDADNRWHVRGPLGQGGPHFGFGATLAEAIDSYILGNVYATDVEASAARFAALSPRQQREIEERDNKAMKSVGGSPDVDSFDVLQRREAVENAKAAAKRLDSPINAQSDGAEVGSAINEAGRQRGAKAKGAERNRTRAAARKRSSGAKAKK